MKDKLSKSEWIVYVISALIIVIGGTILFYNFPITKLVLGPIGVLQVLYGLFLFAFNIINILIMPHYDFISGLTVRGLQGTIIYLISCILFTISFFVVHITYLSDDQITGIMMLSFLIFGIQFLALGILMFEYKERRKISM